MDGGGVSGEEKRAELSRGPGEMGFAWGRTGRGVGGSRVPGLALSGEGRRAREQNGGQMVEWVVATAAWKQLFGVPRWWDPTLGDPAGPAPTFLQFGGQRKLGQEEGMEAAWADSGEDRTEKWGRECGLDAPSSVCCHGCPGQTESLATSTSRGGQLAIRDRYGTR